MVFGGEQVRLSEDQVRRLRLILTLELFPGWTVEYAEQIMEERPLVISDRFALERAREKNNERKREKSKR